MKAGFLAGDAGESLEMLITARGGEELETLIAPGEDKRLATLAEVEAIFDCTGMMRSGKIDKRRGDFWGLGEFIVRRNPSHYAVCATTTIDFYCAYGPPHVSTGSSTSTTSNPICSIIKN